MNSCLALEYYPGFPCEMCHKLLPMNDTYFYYHSGDTKPYVYRCKKCYPRWRKELKSRVEVPAYLKLRAKELTADLVNTFYMHAADKLQRRRDINWLEDLGFHYIGSGYSRDVFTYSDNEIVLKVEPHASLKSDCDLDHQNYNEVYTWKRIPKKLRKYFAKLIAYDHVEYKWILQEKVTGPREVTHIQRMRLRKKLEDQGISLNDLNSDNFGLDSHRHPVIIDYGRDQDIGEN